LGIRIGRYVLESVSRAEAKQATEPHVRVVVELTKDEFTRLERGAPGHNVADFLRVAGVAVADFQAKEKLSPS
jgi:hypothetical protein